MKTLAVLVALAIAPHLPTHAAPVLESLIVAQKDLTSLDIEGPHRNIANNKIGFINGRISQAYKAQYLGCVLSFHTRENATLRKGEELRILSHQVLRSSRDNCLEWDTDMGGDDICLEYGKPIPMGQLRMELRSKLNLKTMTLTCSAETHDADLLSDIYRHSLGRVLTPELLLN